MPLWKSPGSPLAVSVCLRNRCGPPPVPLLCPLQNLEVKAPYLERLDLTNTAVSGDLKRMLRKLLDAPNPATVALCP